FILSVLDLGCNLNISAKASYTFFSFFMMVLMTDLIMAEFWTTRWCYLVHFVVFLNNLGFITVSVYSKQGTA
ncbi:MAG TPA: hypothetical protein VFM99_04060, partial [Chitinophagales bacterium]|nr:hypothetical protein [Chitinophagales bacterium]